MHSYLVNIWRRIYYEIFASEKPPPPKFIFRIGLHVGVHSIFEFVQLFLFLVVFTDLFCFVLFVYAGSLFALQHFWKYPRTTFLTHIRYLSVVCFSLSEALDLLEMTAWFFASWLLCLRLSVIVFQLLEMNAWFFASWLLCLRLSVIVFQLNEPFSIIIIIIVN